MTYSIDHLCLIKQAKPRTSKTNVIFPNSSTVKPGALSQEGEQRTLIHAYFALHETLHKDQNY